MTPEEIFKKLENIIKQLKELEPYLDETNLGYAILFGYSMQLDLPNDTCVFSLANHADCYNMLHAELSLQNCTIDEHTP